MTTTITTEKIHDATRRLRDHKRECPDCRGNLSFVPGQPDLGVQSDLIVCDTAKKIIRELLD